MEFRTCVLLTLVLAFAEIAWCLLDEPDPVEAALADAYCSPAPYVHHHHTH
jgi:hypothetical protein